MHPHRVGLSGFASPNVRTALSAQRATREPLADYASHFEAVEMDSTFVRFPSWRTVEAWADALPEDFSVSVRMPREVTHVCRLDDTSPVARAVDTLAPLGERLRCVLFTTPPAMVCDMDGVRAVLRSLPDGLASAWEFRDPSWMRPDVVEELVAHGSAPVVADRTDDVAFGELVPGGPLDGAWDLPFLYVRFRRERYSLDEVCDWGETLRAANRPVLGFFKQSPDAVSYALALSELLNDP